MNKKLILIIILSFLFVAVFSVSYTYSLYRSNVTTSVDTKVAAWNIKINNCDVVNPDTGDSTCVTLDEDGTTITKTFDISEMFYLEGVTDVVTTCDSSVENTYLSESKIAPGSSMCFKIMVDTTGTQVSMKYDLKSNLNVYIDDTPEAVIYSDVVTDDGFRLVKNDSLHLMVTDTFASTPTTYELSDTLVPGNDSIKQSATGIIKLSDMKANDVTNEDGTITINEDKYEILVQVIWNNDEKNNKLDTLIGTSKKLKIEVPITIQFEQYLG